MAGGESKKAVPARPIVFELADGEPHHIEHMGEASLRLGPHTRLRIPPGVLRHGTQVVLSLPDLERGPRLLARQIAVGPPVQIESSEPIRGFLDVTLAFDSAKLATTGQGPEDLVCVKWDPVRGELLELRPLSVDTARGILVVRTPGLSMFQPCTAGFVLEMPEFTRTEADDTLAYASDLLTHIAGRVVDTDAEVRLEGAAPGSGWTSQGWFSFEDVPLEVDDTRLTLRALREGEAPYLCEFVVRRAVPRKTIEWPSLYAAGDPAIAEDGRAWASTVLRRSGVAPPIESENLRNFFAGIERPSPTLLWFDVEGDRWSPIPLAPDRHLENEVARLAIREIKVNMQLDVAIDENDPAASRYLLGLERFLNKLEGNARAGAAIIINVVGNLFSTRHLTASPIVPCDRLRDGKVGAAYVMSTAIGLRAASRSWLDSPFRRRHAPRKSDRRDLFDVNVGAGRLYFEEVTNGGQSRRREVVAENVWCAGLSMRAGVENGEPILLALGFPDEDPLAQDADTRNSALRFYRRTGRDQWAAEILVKNRPILDADFVLAEDGAPHVVAAAMMAENDDLNGELLQLTPASGGGWDVQPLRWRTEEGSMSSIGMWPKVVMDAQGRVVCAFVVHDGSNVRYMIARKAQEEGAIWKAAEIANATVSLLTGVVAPPTQGDFTDDVVGQSRLPYSHWTPALAPGPEGGLWYAYGDGVLHLASIDAESLEVSDRTVDVDRALGFFPRLTRRLSGAPIVCAKDLHGFHQDIERVSVPARSALHFFALGQSHLVPRRDPVVAPAPGRRQAFFPLTHFAEKKPVICGGLVDLGFLVIFDQDKAASAVQTLQANLFMNHRIDIHADDVRSTVRITIHLDPPAGSPAGTIANITLVITSNENLLFVSDAAGNEQSDACGISQEGWENIALFFINLDLDPTQLFPQSDQIDIDRVDMRGLRIRTRPVAGVGDQQGAIRFTITVPNMRAEGSHSTGVSFTAVAVEPSVYEFDIAPQVVGGQIHWYLRSVSGRYGRFDVDVDTDFFTWVGVIGAILTGNPAFLAFVAVDPAIDSFGTNLANEELAESGGPPFGGFATLLSGLLAAHANDLIADDEVLTEGTEIEAVRLDHRVLTLFLRRRPSIPEPFGSDAALFPSRIVTFGEATIGEDTVARNVLFVNNGGLPLWFESARVSSGADFALTGAPSWPRIVASGGDALILLEFSPRSGSTGSRAGRLEVKYNGGQMLSVDLGGVAHPPLLPRFSFAPTRLQFGIVTVGSTAQRSLDIRNEGGAELTLNVQLQATGASMGQFALTGFHPQRLAPGESGTIDVDFTPTAMLHGLYDARLWIRTSDPDHPEVFVPLTGQGAAAEILVQPTDIAFNDSPLAAVLPPGLGSTRGFVIYNLGAVNLTLAASSFEIRDAGGAISPDFILQDAAGVALPVRDQILPAGGFLALSVLFRPQTVGDKSAIVRVDYSGGGIAGSVDIQVQGRGIT